MGFEDKERKVDLSKEDPDFEGALAKYNSLVESIGLQIKAANEELEAVLTRLAEAKADLQAQYNKRIDDLGGQIQVLEAHIEDLKGKVASLEAQVAERQATKEAIQLDFESERKTLAEEWTELHKNSAAIMDAEQSLAEDRADLKVMLEALLKEQDSFGAYKAAEATRQDVQREEITKLQEAADIKASEAASLLTQANDKLKALAEETKTLDAKIAEAQAVIALADDINAQKIQNEKDKAYISTQALQNQKDVTEIKVARVALNNLKQQLDAREQLVSAAERKIGG